MYGTVGGIETDMYWTLWQPVALFGLSGLIFLTTVMDGTWQRITGED